MTKTIGHHVFKWGWEALRVREDDSGPESDSASSEPLPSGSYTFSGITTAYPYDKPNTSNSLASFLVEFSLLSFETEAPWFVDGGAAQLPKWIETWPPLSLG